MSINTPYSSVEELPAALPIFPLDGALLLPRGELPLNIFEPRYMAMIDIALSSHRLIGMVQPDNRTLQGPGIHAIGCAGRITQIAETGDGRYVLSLTGVARFKLLNELKDGQPFRHFNVDFSDYAQDLMPRAGEDDVNRDGVLVALKNFARVNKIKVDWQAIDEAPNEALVNALSMMCPFGASEKQALLEAVTLQTRAEILIAISEMSLAKTSGNDTVLQ